PAPRRPPRAKSRAFMNPRIALCCLLAVLPAARAFAAGAPVGVFLARGSEDGHILLGELGCVACHKTPALGEQLRARQAPRLAEVGARVTPAYLRAFLTAPHKVKPGTPMPDVLHGLAAEKHAAAVEDLVHFLAGMGGPLQYGKSAPARVLVERGKALYHAVG